MKEKKSRVVMPPYEVRIREYNREKQTAFLGCETQEQMDRVVEYLRKKWRV